MDLEGHNVVDNSRNYMVQVSESNGSSDANFTLIEKVGADELSFRHCCHSRKALSLRLS